MLRRRGLVLVAVLVASLFPSSLPAGPVPAPPAGAPGKDELLEESWHAVFLQDARAGHIHSVVTRTPGPKPVVHSATSVELAIARMGQTVALGVEMNYDEDEQGRILGFSMTTRASGKPMNVIGHVEGDKLLLVAGDDNQIRQRPWDDTVIGPYAAERRLLAQGLRPGLKFAFDTFSLEVLRKMRVAIEVKQKETVDVQGKPRLLWRAEATQDILPGTVIVSWLDDEGRVVKSNVRMLGMTMSYVQCTREEALLPAQSPELFLSRAMIRVERKVPDFLATRDALYRLRFQNPAALKLNLEDERQAIVGREGDSVFLRVRTVDPPAQPSAAPPAGLREYLRSAPYLQSDDAAVIAAARKAAGDEKDPWKRAKRLETWVRRAITRKGLSVGFASAKETLIAREGDCTEHAVLLAALLRAVGTPSRVAFGLVYFDGPETGGPVFAAHMWTETWVGEWVALDATLARPFVDAMHIKLGASALDDPTPSSDFLDLVHVLGQTSIEILSVQPGASAAKPSQRPAGDAAPASPRQGRGD